MTYWAARGTGDETLLSWCPTCRGKWSLYTGAWDVHGSTIRCSGCLRAPSECFCR